MHLTFVYLNETWIYQNGSVSLRRWVHESDLKSSATKIKSKGSRFTIPDAESQYGFLDGCNFLLLLISKDNDSDFHKKMESTLVQNWMNQLVPALAKLNKKCGYGQRIISFSAIG